MINNVFAYAAICEKNWEANLADMTDYKRKYTFYSDFSIADFYQGRGVEKNAIKDTYKNVINSWGSSIDAMAEIVMVLNHKSFSFYYGVDSSYMGCDEYTANEIGRLYANLYEKAKDFVYEKFGNDKDAMSYYFKVTD